MKSPARLLAVAAIALASAAHAGTLTNTFDSDFNYVTNGIIGDPNWDGVYLKFGDVPGGSAGGNGNGFTTYADTTFMADALTIQSAGGGWSGAENDGFFIYRIVDGDFDVSVENLPAQFENFLLEFDNRAFNFAGLMVRAYHTNNSGAPFSTTVTNAAENFVNFWRFNEFDIDTQIRVTTNNAVSELNRTWVGANDEVANSRFFRITRVGNVFTFYVKTNSFDPWYQVTNGLPAGGVLTRDDWEGVALQVGIAHAPFSTETRDAFFDNFELTGPNVVVPTTFPEAPSSVVISSPNPSGSVDVSWTPGAGSDGSLVVVRANGPIISQPRQGVTYTADANFQSTDNLLSASNTHIVYAGPGNSVTVTGLGGSNNVYSVAVFSYSGSGSSIVYNTAAPATNSLAGPGQLGSVSFTLEPPSIPVNGVAVATLTATYTSGDSYDVSSDPGSSWGSSNPGVAVAANGTVTGVGIGTANISVTFSGVSANKDVEVRAPAFSDDFSASHNFVERGVAGSRWDGVYLGAGDVPFQVSQNLGPAGGIVSVANANVTSNGLLTVTHRQTGWEDNENDGFFLYKVVNGDFQVAVRIDSYQNQTYHFPGLMARLFGPDGRPAGTANATHQFGRESHVRWMRFDEFSITTSARRNLNGGNQVFDIVDGETTAYWLLMVRQGTTFTFYKRSSQTEPWVLVPGATRVLATATNGAPIQVGIGASTFDSGQNFRTVTFDDFMLDGPLVSQGVAPAGSPANADATVNLANGTLTLEWENAPDSDGTLVVLRANKPVNMAPISGQTYTASSVFGMGSNLGSSNFVVYAGSGTSVTVSGLQGGLTYYAAFFAMSNSAGVYSYNQQTTAAQVSQLVGALQGVDLRISGNGRIPLGGVGLARATALYTGGGALDVTASMTLTSDNPAVVTVTNVNNLNALSLGTANITAVYGGKTNTLTVTVDNPTYVENFDTTHNYLAAGVGGTMWDGVYFGSANNYPPETGFSFANASTGVGQGQTLVCDANLTVPGELAVQSSGTDWEFDDDDGFFLFKYIPGDFQIRVHITTLDTAQVPPAGPTPNINAGLMARQYGPAGAPSEDGENWVSWSRFDLYGITTDARSTTDGGTQRLETRDGSTNYWLLLVRDGDNFHFFEKAAETDLWIERNAGVVVRPDLAGGLQVGIQQATFAETFIETHFDSVMLDAALPVLEARATAEGIEVRWPHVPGVVLQTSPSLTQPSWTEVELTPTQENGYSRVTLPPSAGSAYFRLVQ